MEKKNNLQIALLIIISIIVTTSCHPYSGIKTSITIYPKKANDYIGDLLHIEEVIENIIDIDTLHLRLEHSSILNSAKDMASGDYFIVKNLSLCGDTIGYCSFDGTNLNIPLKCMKHKPSHCVISYDYQGSTFLSLKKSAVLGFLNSCSLFLSSWNSWYFIGHGVKPSTVTINGLNNSISLSNCQQEYINDSTVVLYPNMFVDKEIDMAILRKDYYDNKIYSVGETVISRYFRCHGEDLANKCFIKDNEVIKRDSIIKELLINLNSFFDSPKSITIVDNFCHSDNHRFGFTMHSTDDSYSILMDTLCYYNGMLAHELIHCYLPDVISCDKGKYLFSESLVELISQYIGDISPYYSSNLTTDKVIELSSNTDYISIFDIDSNHTGNDTHIGTSTIIYEIVPQKIKKFVDEIGTNKAKSILKDYASYLKSHNGDIIFNDIETIIINNGVDREGWNLFINSL